MIPIIYTYKKNIDASFQANILGIDKIFKLKYVFPVLQHSYKFVVDNYATNIMPCKDTANLPRCFILIISKNKINQLWFRHST